MQVENEYGNVEWAYGVGGELYVKWAADTAVNLNTSVPWVMCQQEDAPDPIVSVYHMHSLMFPLHLHPDFICFILQELTKCR